MYQCNKNQQHAHFLHYNFNLIVVSKTCFKHPSVYPLEDLYVQFYGIFSCIPLSSLVDGRTCSYFGVSCFCLHVLLYHIAALILYNFSAINQTAYMYARKKYHKTACTSLPDDEHLDVQDTLKTL